MSRPSDNEVIISLDLDDADPFDPDPMDDKAEPKLRSMVSKDTKKRTKGRGHASVKDESDRYVTGDDFKTIEGGKEPGPQRSIEGWIIFLSGLNEEASEEDLQDKFSEFGEIKNLHLNLDRRTGFVKGYALIEYETKEEAARAVEQMNNTKFMDRRLSVDWAFSTVPRNTRGSTRKSRGTRYH